MIKREIIPLDANNIMTRGSSGKFGTSNQYIEFWLEIITHGQNTANNTSDVTVNLCARRINTGYTTWGSGSTYLRIWHDSGVYEKTNYGDITITNTPQVYHSWRGNVGHASNGTRWLNVSGNIQIGSGILSSSTCSYGEWLKDIPRVSSFTLNKSSCELKSPFTVNISKSHSSFTHSIIYKIGSRQEYVRVWNSSDTSVSFTPPLSDAGYITQSTSGTATIIVETYSGSTWIGSTSKTITITVPASVVPSFSNLSLEPIKTYWGLYIKDKSQAKLTINGAAQAYGSPISKYTISGGGFSANAATMTTGVFAAVGSITFTGTITDARGRSASKTVSLTVVDYFKPRIDNFIFNRCLSNGTLDDDGTYVKVIPTFTYASVNGNNTIAANVKYREVGVTAWSDATNVTNNGTVIIGGGKFNPDKSYEIMLTVSDYFESSTKSDIVQTAFTTMDFLMGGKGIAMGKVAQTEDYFDVNFRSWFRKDVTFGEEVEARLGARIGREYTDGLGHYNYTNGFLITTNISKTTNTMFEIYIQGNSYGTQHPIDTCINGYVYNQGLVNCSGLANGYNISMKLFFNSAGMLCLWFQQYSTYTTFRFKLCTTFGQLTPKYTVADSGQPSGQTSETWVNMYQGYNSKNSWVIVEHGTNTNGEYIRFSNNMQICFKKVTQTINITNPWGSLYESTATMQFGSWAGHFKSGTVPTISAVLANAGAGGFVCNVFSVTNSSAGGSWIARPNNSPNVSVTVNLVAFGFYK